MEEVRHNGFTLAEVLVTLGIIGVVSAMTVPTLMQNHQRKVYVTQLHKVYNELSQAVVSYTASKKAVNLKEARVGTTDGLKDFVSSQFKTVNICDDKATPCFASSYSTISGTALDTSLFNPASAYSSCFTTAGGYSICFTNITNLIAVYIDVNGAAGPNIAGRDFFKCGISTRHNLVDVYSVAFSVTLYDDPNAFGSTAARETAANGCVKGTDGGMDCFAKILVDNWEMNY